MVRINHDWGIRKILRKYLRAKYLLVSLNTSDAKFLISFFHYPSCILLPVEVGITLAFLDQYLFLLVYLVSLKDFAVLFSKETNWTKLGIRFSEFWKSWFWYHSSHFHVLIWEIYIFPPLSCCCLEAKTHLLMFFLDWKQMVK